jgi:hypothetical protein
MSLRDHILTLIEAGIDVSRLNSLEIYELTGKLINDSKLTERALAYLQGSVLPMDAHDRALRAMTPQERLELRERVTGVIPFVKKIVNV